MHSMTTKNCTQSNSHRHKPKAVQQNRNQIHCIAKSHMDRGNHKPMCYGEVGNSKKQEFMLRHKDRTWGDKIEHKFMPFVENTQAKWQNSCQMALVAEDLADGFHGFRFACTAYVVYLESCHDMNSGNTSLFPVRFCSESMLFVTLSPCVGQFHDVNLSPDLHLFFICFDACLEGCLSIRFPKTDVVMQ